jgi:hypothetical protein
MCQAKNITLCSQLNITAPIQDQEGDSIILCYMKGSPPSLPLKFKNILKVNLYLIFSFDLSKHLQQVTPKIPYPLQCDFRFLTYGYDFELVLSAYHYVQQAEFNLNVSPYTYFFSNNVDADGTMTMTSLPQFPATAQLSIASDRIFNFTCSIPALGCTLPPVTIEVCSIIYLFCYIKIKKHLLPRNISYNCRLLLTDVTAWTCNFHQQNPDSYS